MKEITSGKHVNELSGMWAKWLGAGPEANVARDFLAHYSGMAVQDVLMMGLHGSVSNYAKTIARGEDYTWDTAYHDAKHAAIMGLVFPAIRLVPFGGKESLKHGYQNFMRSYKNMDYKRMMKENGEESMTGLVKLIQRGGLFELKGLSTFRHKGYTEKESVLYSFYLGLTKECIDAILPWEKYGRWGGDGFSKYDLAYDIAGIGTAYIIDKLWKPKENKNGHSIRFDNVGISYTYMFH